MIVKTNTKHQHQFESAKDAWKMPFGGGNFARSGRPLPGYMRGGVWSGRVRSNRIYTIPFTDHAGRPALTVFESEAHVPLPHLYSFAIYFTHPDASADSINAKEILKTIKSPSPYEHQTLPLRLDLYFVPGGDAQTCMQHYHSEKEERGLFGVQMESMKKKLTENDDEYDPDRTDEPPPGYGAQSDEVVVSKIPGMVPSYLDNDALCCYHSIIWVCSFKSWDDNLSSNESTQEVAFDPITPEEYATWIEGCESEPETLQPFKILLQPVATSREQKIGGAPIGMTIFSISHSGLLQETLGLWQDACSRGWRSW